MFDETDFKITDGLEHHKKFKQLGLDKTSLNGLNVLESVG